MATHEPNLSIQMALLDSMASPGMKTASQQLSAIYQEIPRQQVDFQLKQLQSSIESQGRKLHETHAVKLNFRDLLEARMAGEFFASLFPDDQRARLGIMELLINAIEHGNLGIGASEKHALMQENRWMDEVNHRLTLQQFQPKRVHAYCYIDKDYTQLAIRDDGDGFDWRPYLYAEQPPSHHILNGRGIATAKHIAFDEMGYCDQGNMVWALQYLNK